MPVRYICSILIVLTFCKNPITTPVNRVDPTHNESIAKVSVDTLVNGEWVEDVRIVNQYLRFRKNGEFRHKISFEGCGGSNGRFRIEEQTIFFSDIQEIEGCTPWFSEKTTCQIVNTPNDIYFKEVLRCQANGAKQWPLDFQLLNKKKPQKIGTTILLSGQSSLILDQKIVKISENAVFRQEPSVNASRANYRESIDCDKGITDQKSYLPKGQKIKLLARTRDKATVQKWQNYWYYVCPITCDVYMGEGCFFSGWVYGEFISK